MRVSQVLCRSRHHPKQHDWRLWYLKLWVRPLRGKWRKHLHWYIQLLVFFHCVLCVSFDRRSFRKKQLLSFPENKIGEERTYLFRVLVVCPLTTSPLRDGGCSNFWTTHWTPTSDAASSGSAVKTAAKITMYANIKEGSSYNVIQLNECIKKLDKN